MKRPKLGDAVLLAALAGILGLTLVPRERSEFKVSPNAKTAQSAQTSNPLLKVSSYRTGPNTKIEDGRIMAVYYQTDEDKLNGSQKADIHHFLKTFPPNTPYLNEGSADWRGAADYNEALSQRRVSGTTEYMQSQLGGNADIVSAHFGERKSHQGTLDASLLQQDRKVRIIPNKSVVEAGLDWASKYAKIFLIDGSGSMGGSAFKSRNVSKWSVVQNYDFTPDADIHVFSSFSPHGGTGLKDLIPSGQTPLYKSLYELIERARPGESIAVLTDGEDNDSGVRIIDGITGFFGMPFKLRSQSDVVNLARGKHISLYLIGVGVKTGFQEQLKTLANETGGLTYFRGSQ